MISDAESQMEIKEFLKKHASIIDSEIEKYIPRKATKQWLEEGLGKTVFEWDVNSYTKTINEPFWDFIDRGGKRWRPILACIACEAVGGKWEEALNVAPIVEIIHNGTIMQDDIEDDSQSRRGKPCTHKLFGIDIAENTATFMYFRPMVKIMNNTFNLSKEKLNKVFNLYIKEMNGLVSGQGLDIIWHRGGISPNEKHYLQMCLNKTGILSEFSTMLGAIIGEATQKQIDALGKFGQIIGVGLQIQDDILELTECDFQEKKGSLCGDIHEGKRTLMVIRTLEKATKEEKKRLIEILDSHTLENSKIREALDIIFKYDGIDYSKKRAEELITGAWKEVDSVLKESNAKNMLKKFAEYLVDRKM